MALDPDAGLAHQWYGNYLTAMGRFDEAEEAMRRAHALDPFRIFARAVLGWVWFYSGNYDGAADHLATSIELSPTTAMLHMWRGQTLEMLGRTDEALDAYRRGVELSDQGSAFLAALARGHAVRGERADAEQVLARIPGGRHVPAYEIAKVHIALGTAPKRFAGWTVRSRRVRTR